MLQHTGKLLSVLRAHPWLGEAAVVDVVDVGVEGAAWQKLYLRITSKLILI
jgi:hypothetical protein